MATHPDTLRIQERNDLLSAMTDLSIVLAQSSDADEGLDPEEVAEYAQAARAAVEKALGIIVPQSALGADGYNHFNVRKPILGHLQVGEAVRLRGAFAPGVYLIITQGENWTALVRPEGWYP